jgi:hypothetical protein
LALTFDLAADYINHSLAESSKGNIALQDDVYSSAVANKASRQIKAYFRGDSLKVFRAPIVEVVFLTLKPGNTEESVSQHLETLTSTGPDSPACVAATWGSTNIPDLLIMIAGWESKEVLLTLH